jgi:hypothetical protein
VKARAFSLLLLAGAVALSGFACDRRIEPFDPDEQVAAPDLSKIFPPGAERAPADGSLSSAMGGQEAEGSRMGGRGAAPQGGAAAVSASAESEGAPIRGRIVLAPELAERVPAAAVLFLIARAGEAGPPTAVKRVASPRFPLEFEIGPDDRMIDTMPFSGPFRLSARIDADGSATSRNPGDLQGEVSGRVDPGATGVELVIDEVL